MIKQGHSNFFAGRPKDINFLEKRSLGNFSIHYERCSGIGEKSEVGGKCIIDFWLDGRP